MRAASSKGAADLIALWPNKGSCGTFLNVPSVWLVQCKRDGKLPKRERETLEDLGRETGAIPVLAKSGKGDRGVVCTTWTGQDISYIGR